MPHDTAEGTPWTFALDNGGDIRMTENNTAALVGGDLATVQDLKVALETYSRNLRQNIRGEDPRDPDFGLDVFDAVGSNQALKREVRRTLEYDDYRHNRVSSIRDIDIIRHGSRDVTVECTISLHAQPEDITLVFDLFSGQTSIHGDTTNL